MIYPAMQEILDTMAKAGGAVVAIEGSEPFDRDVLGDAVDAGLVRVSRGSGWEIEDWFSLTAAGREVCGLPPPPPGLFARIWFWMNQRAARLPTRD